jgi:hypothetical protein
MDAALAELAAGTLRDEANAAARKDLGTLQRQAVEAGRDRSRSLIKTSRIDHHTGEIRYNPAGRAMRDWYLHVYLNTLRGDLGQPAVTVDAQQIEDMVRLVRTTQPQSDPLEALQAVAVVRNVAVDDAAHAAARIVTTLRAAAMRRAIETVPDGRFDADQFSIQIGRHWYQRCYDDHVHGTTSARQPLTGVTHVEEEHVAAALTTGTARRLIGTDGVPLVTIHNTATNPVDRQLAAGDIGVVPQVSDPDHLGDPNLRLRSRVIRTWHALTDDERARWGTLADTETTPPANWPDIPGTDQDRLIRLYLDTHRPEYLNHPFEPPELTGDPTLTAMAMFNHTHPLLSTGTDTARHLEATAQPARNAQLDHLEHTAYQTEPDTQRPGLHT